MSKKAKKPLPVFKTDEEAEHFVDTADLTEYDLSGGRRVQFEFSKKTKQVNLRMPEAQVEALKALAKKRGVPYQRLIREGVERVLAEG